MGRESYISLMKRANGFSMIELMITVSLLAIVLGLAFPSMRTLMQNNRAASIANELTTAITLARSEAINRSQTVTVCPCTSTANCTAGTCAASGTTNWATGWVVRNAAGTIRPFPAITDSAPGATLTGTANGSTFLEFGSSGFKSGSANFQFDLVIPNCKNNNNRRIVVSPQGRPGVSAQSC